MKKVLNVLLKALLAIIVGIIAGLIVLILVMEYRQKAQTRVRFNKVQAISKDNEYHHSFLVRKLFEGVSTKNPISKELLTFDEVFVVIEWNDKDKDTMISSGDGLYFFVIAKNKEKYIIVRQRVEDGKSIVAEVEYADKMSQPPRSWIFTEVQTIICGEKSPLISACTPQAVIEFGSELIEAINKLK